MKNSKCISAIFVLAIAPFCVNAQEEDSTYLNCQGDLKDLQYPEATGSEEISFFIDRGENTIAIFLSGLSADNMNDLTFKYTETPTHYLSTDAGLSIDRQTLRFTYSGIQDLVLSGHCEIANRRI
jgi:hypothetical protein